MRIIKTIGLVMLFAAALGSTDKPPKPTLKSLAGDVEDIKMVLIGFHEQDTSDKIEIVTKILELEERIKALEARGNSKPAMIDLKAPSSPDKMNRFSGEYNKYIELLQAGVLDIKQWVRVEQAWGGLE